MSRIRPVLSCVIALALCVPTFALAEGSDTWDPSYDWDHWDNDGITTGITTGTRWGSRLGSRRLRSRMRGS
jgi:hypothetical protein